jgi:hypothetical protein
MGSIRIFEDAEEREQTGAEPGNSLRGKTMTAVSTGEKRSQEGLASLVENLAIRAERLRLDFYIDLQEHGDGAAFSPRPPGPSVYQNHASSRFCTVINSPQWPFLSRPAQYKSKVVKKS